MKKQLPALLTALLMTGFITLVMVVTSANALFSQGAPASANSATTSNLDQAQIQQLQARINEYAQREQQLQQQLQSSQTQLSQATNQAEQLQQVLMALEARGLIQIQNNGRILITSSPNR